MLSKGSRMGRRMGRLGRRGIPCPPAHHGEPSPSVRILDAAEETAAWRPHCPRSQVAVGWSGTFRGIGQSPYVTVSPTAVTSLSRLPKQKGNTRPQGRTRCTRDARDQAQVEAWTPAPRGDRALDSLAPAARPADPPGAGDAGRRGVQVAVALRPRPSSAVPGAARRGPAERALAAPRPGPAAAARRSWQPARHAATRGRLCGWPLPPPAVARRIGPPPGAPSLAAAAGPGPGGVRERRGALRRFLRPVYPPLLLLLAFRSCPAGGRSLDRLLQTLSHPRLRPCLCTEHARPEARFPARRTPFREESCFAEGSDLPGPRTSQVLTRGGCCSVKFIECLEFVKHLA